MSTSVSNTIKTPKELTEIARTSIKETLKRSGLFVQEQKGTEVSKSQTIASTSVKSDKVLKEAMVVLPKTYVLRTDWLSSKTKEAHEELYKGYTNQFNLASSKLDAISREDITDLRDLKLRETFNLNSIKLHELYFSNISDQSSEIHRNSIPYMRLSRDWGTFEAWQLDFRAVALASTEGWAILCYEPYKDKYMNLMIDGHTSNVPLNCIPILVLDMWSHAYYKDYLNDKKSYINAMLREINWKICEARMVIAERACLKDLYLVRPLVDNEPQKMVDAVTNMPPIGQDQIVPGGVQVVAPGSDAQIQQGVK